MNSQPISSAFHDAHELNPIVQAHNQDPLSNIQTMELNQSSASIQKKNPQSCDAALEKTHLMKTLEAAAALATYCLSAISATILNRYVLSDLRFGMNAMLLIYQWILSIIFLLFLRSIGVINFRLLHKDELVRWIPVAIGIASMAYSGSKCLEHCAISIVTIFKNTSILLVAFGDLFFFKKKISLLTYFSFFLIILSSFLGTIGDSRITATGITWLVINCIATAMYVLCLKGTLKTIKFKDFDTVFNNSLVAIPFMLIVSLFFDSWDKFLKY